jgi:hypothetical protein
MIRDMGWRALGERQMPGQSITSIDGRSRTTGRAPGVADLDIAALLAGIGG